jgi:UDP-glucose 4-epimerase
MKVLVIGGAGYIGSHAVYELIRNNHEVVIMDNLSTGREKSVNKKAVFYQGDITNKADLEKVFETECKKRPIDVVMHFAAKIIVPESVEKPLEYYHNNVEGVRLMLETMVQYNVKNVIFSSTAAVYGEPKKEICEEDDVLKPINPYGATKLAVEEMIKWTANAYKMNYGIFRYFNVAGADESLEIGYNYERPVITHIIPIIAEVALGMREKFMVYGNDYDTPDGTCIRDYVHVTDLARAHVLGAEYIMANNKSFTVNLGSNEGYSVKQIIDATNKIKPIKYEMAKRRPGDPAKLIASNKRVKEILNWEPKYTIEDMIRTDIAYRSKIDYKR